MNKSIDKTQEALKLALEALEAAEKHHLTTSLPQAIQNYGSRDAYAKAGFETWLTIVPHAITAIRAALASKSEALTLAPTEQEQPAQQQEPVVRWVCKGCRHEYMEAPSSCDCMESREYERVEYFTSPPASKPLTDEFILSLHYGCSTSLKFARAIEAAHGIKE